MRQVDCPICEKDHSVPLFCVEGLQLVRCSVCGLTYYNPDVDPEEHYALLNEDFFVSQAIQKVKKSGSEYNFDVYMKYVKDPSTIGYPDYLEPEHLKAKESWGKIVLGWFIKEWQKQGFKGLPSSILEMGSAAGAMLTPFLEAEWAPVVGQEVSSWIVEHKDPRVDVRLGELHALDFGDAKFNCILMWDSFEHTQYPNECLKKISEATTEQALLIMQTPDVDYSTANWYLFSPGQHVLLLNHRTAELLFGKFGWKLVGERVSPEPDEAIYIFAKGLGSETKSRKSFVQ